MNGLASTALALAMIAAMLLLVGGVVLVRRDPKRGALMIVAALVLAGNVMIWTL